MYDISFKYISGVNGISVSRIFHLKVDPPTIIGGNNGVGKRGRWRVINYIAYVYIYMYIEIIVGAVSKI